METTPPGPPEPGSDLRAWALALVAAQPSRNGSGIADLLHRVCDAAVSALALDGAAVTVRSGDMAEAVAASSGATASALAQLEFGSGGGPSHECWERRRPVLVSDLAQPGAAPWPAFVPAALAAGARAVFALPLQIGAARFGAITLYSALPRTLRPDEVARAVALVALATEMLLDSSEATADGDIDPNLKSALDVRGEIYQAQGMVMAGLGIGLSEALARLRAHAFATDSSLLDVATDVISGRLHFERDRN